MIQAAAERAQRQAQRMVDTALALSVEQDPERRLVLLLDDAMAMTRADGGTLYIVDDDQKLRFEIMRNHTLGIALPDATGNRPTLEPLPLRTAAGQPNRALVATFAALEGVTVNIPDAYEAQGFDFSGTRRYDAATGYRSRSFLTVPLRNHEDDVIGVLQLINALDENEQSVAFQPEDQALIESLATLAALILTNLRLIEGQKELFESFIRVIANAIDEKNPHTSNHCKRLPVIAEMIARAVGRTKVGPYQDNEFSEEELYELSIAAWMHDCGKITTPEHVINKATKLEALCDRLEVVQTRIELLKRDATIEMLQIQASAESDDSEKQLAAQKCQARLDQLADDLEFLRRANLGGEFMDPEDKARIRRIASYQWTDEQGQVRCLLNEDEISHLLIERGTLSPQERGVINRHIDVTIRMLDSLTYPKHLANVPEIAGGHHEHMDGTGYPRGLSREHLSVRARIMGIADIFEALTAADRPYKSGKKLTEALRIMGRMRLNDHIDPDLFDLFVREKVYLEYARAFMNEDQIDTVDHSSIPGYSGD